MLTSTPLNATIGEPLVIDCSSAVPPNLQGTVTVTLMGPDGSILRVANNPTRAETMFTIDSVTEGDSGTYRCIVSVSSPFLTSEDNSRPLQDSAELTVDPSELLL